MTEREFIDGVAMPLFEGGAFGASNWVNLEVPMSMAIDMTGWLRTVEGADHPYFGLGGLRIYFRPVRGLKEWRIAP